MNAKERAEKIANNWMNHPANVEALTEEIVSQIEEAEREARRERDISCPNHYCQEDHDSGNCGCNSSALISEAYSKGLNEGLLDAPRQEYLKGYDEGFRAAREKAAKILDEIKPQGYLIAEKILQMEPGK